MNNRNVAGSICHEKIPFTKKIIIKINRTKTKMNNNVCIISNEVNIFSNGVSKKSKNIIKLAAERLF